MSEIPNIFHILYINTNLNIYHYYSILSIININKPDLVYFHYYDIPEGKYWDLIKNKICLKKQTVPKKLFQLYKKAIIYNILNDYGGIYVDINSIFINPIHHLLNNNDFIKSDDDKIIFSTKNNPITYNSFLFYRDNPTSILTCSDDKKIFYLNYEINNDFLYEEIFDYSFGSYFHLIKNCYIYFYNEELLKNNIENFIFNNITVYNLLVRNCISYDLIKNQINTNDLSIFKNKFDLINNIDIIYWINLEKSIERKEKMEYLLKHINIKNERISAIDGSEEEDINKKYFYEKNDNYPKYLNKEYAILLSHLTTIEKYIDLQDSNYSVALILEDDMSYDFINYWNKDIKTIINEAPEDWDIIMLGYFSLNIKNNELYKKWDNEWSALSYLVNYKSMQKIKNLKNDGKWICDEKDLMVSDNYIFSKFNTYVYKYPYFTFPNDNDSTFHSDHLDYHRIYKINNYITLEGI